MTINYYHVKQTLNFLPFKEEVQTIHAENPLSWGVCSREGRVSHQKNICTNNVLIIDTKFTFKALPSVEWCQFVVSCKPQHSLQQVTWPYIFFTFKKIFSLVKSGSNTDSDPSLTFSFLAKLSWGCWAPATCLSTSWSTWICTPTWSPPPLPIRSWSCTFALLSSDASSHMWWGQEHSSVLPHCQWPN